MSPRLQDELKQTRPWGNLQEEVAISILRTAAVLEHETAQVLKPAGITTTQYNVLRILRGAEPDGLGRNEVRDRLISPVPDATRLLDRLADMGLVVRTRGGEDRRVVVARITRAGLELIAPLDAVLERLHRRQLGHLGERKLRTLVGLLAEAREHP